MRGQRQGRRTGRGEEASPHQRPPYLLGYVFKFISCQFTLESQPENVHAALIMTTTATSTFIFGLRRAQVHFCQPCGVGLIIAISQTRKAEVWRGDISLPRIRPLQCGRLRLGLLTALCTAHSTRPQAAPEGPPWSSDYRKRIAWTPFSPEEGIPGLVIPNPDFLHLTANQEVIDIFYKTGYLS